MRRRRDEPQYEPHPGDPWHPTWVDTDDLFVDLTDEEIAEQQAELDAAMARVDDLVIDLTAERSARSAASAELEGRRMRKAAEIQRAGMAASTVATWARARRTQLTSALATTAARETVAVEHAVELERQKLAVDAATRTVGELAGWEGFRLAALSTFESDRSVRQLEMVKSQEAAASVTTWIGRHAGRLAGSLASAERHETARLESHLRSAVSDHVAAIVDGAAPPSGDGQRESARLAAHLERSHATLAQDSALDHVDRLVAAQSAATAGMHSGEAERSRRLIELAAAAEAAATVRALAEDETRRHERAVSTAADDEESRLSRAIDVGRSEDAAVVARRLAAELAADDAERTMRMLRMEIQRAEAAVAEVATDADERDRSARFGDEMAAAVRRAEASHRETGARELRSELAIVAGITARTAVSESFASPVFAGPSLNEAESSSPAPEVPESVQGWWARVTRRFRRAETEGGARIANDLQPEQSSEDSLDRDRPEPLEHDPAAPGAEFAGASDPAPIDESAPEEQAGDWLDDEFLEAAIEGTAPDGGDDAQPGDGDQSDGPIDIATLGDDDVAQDGEESTALGDDIEGAARPGDADVADVEAGDVDDAVEAVDQGAESLPAGVEEWDPEAATDEGPESVGRVEDGDVDYAAEDVGPGSESVGDVEDEGDVDDGEEAVDPGAESVAGVEDGDPDDGAADAALDSESDADVEHAELTAHPGAESAGEDDAPGTGPEQDLEDFDEFELEPFEGLTVDDDDADLAAVDGPTLDAGDDAVAADEHEAGLDADMESWTDPSWGVEAPEDDIGQIEFEWHGEEIDTIPDFAAYTPTQYMNTTTQEYAGLAADVAKAAGEVHEMSAVAAGIPGIESGMLDLDDMMSAAGGSDDVVIGEQRNADLTLRVMTGVGLVVLFGLSLAYQWSVAVLIGAIILLAAGEFFASLVRGRYRPLTLVGLGGVAAALAVTWVWGVGSLPVVLLLVVMTVILFYAIVPRPAPLVNTVASIMVVVWVGGLGSFAMDIVHAPDYRWLVGAFVVTVGMMDVAQYFFGRRLGKRPLAPVVSPKKTLEGLIAGVVVAVAVGAAWGLAPPLDLATGIGLGVAVAIVAPFGDLAISVVKRALGIKDMGTILPGHGGALDRIDAMIVALPAAWIVFSWAGVL